MSSSLESSVRDIQIGCYIAVIIIVVVGYDYVLTLSREVENIWCRPWTQVSALFVVVRYIGLCWAITLALIGTALVPGPVKPETQVSRLPSSTGMRSGYCSKGKAMLVIGDWGYIIFLAAADLVMILRVYAMWDQCKIILGFLLLFYVPQVVVSAVWEGIYNYPGRTISVTVVQVRDFKYCSYSAQGAPSATYRAIPRFILGGALLILAIIPTFQQSIDMYNVSKRWRINRAMKLLLREGAVYFIVNVLFNIVNAVRLPTVGILVFLDTFSYSLSCAIMPRFIIDIRELYDRDLRNRWQGIDTGFGILEDICPEVQVAEGRTGESEEIELDVLVDDALV